MSPEAKDIQDEIKEVQELEPDLQTSQANWTDILWVPVTFAIFVGYIVICSVDLNDYVKTRCYLHDKFDNVVRLFDMKCFFVLIAGAVEAILFSLIYYLLACFVTPQFVLVTMVLQLGFSLAKAVYAIIMAQWLSLGSSLVWMVFSTIVYWCVRRHISRATEILRVVMSVAKSNPSIIIVSAIGAVLSTAYALLTGMALMASYAKADSPECSIQKRQRTQPELVGALIWVSFSNSLFLGLIRATVRTAIGSVYGWYIYQQTPPRFPVVGGLLRSLTYSFGSLCFASILLAIGMLVANIMTSLAELFMGTGSDLSLIMLTISLSHGITVADWVLGHFHNVVLTHVALYNDSYLTGVQKTIALIKKRPYPALLNECLAGGILTFGSWCIGMSATFVCYIYLRHIIPYPVEGIPFILSYVLGLGIEVGGVFTAPIASGVHTTFVALSYDEDALNLARHNSRENNL